MIIGQDTELGQKIQVVLKGIVAFLKSWKPEMSDVGLLPSFIAKEVVPPDKLTELSPKIAPAKRVRLNARTNASYLEPFKRSIIVELEKADPHENDREVKSAVEYR